jgi:hypothetical protein
LSIVGGAAAAALVYGIAFQASLGRLGNESAANIAEWYRFKENVLHATPAPRWVIVAGSSGLYGVSARQIEEALGIRTVNFATHAALPLDYLLAKVQASVEPGDTVVLALEYEFYAGAGAPNTVFSDYILGGDPGYLAGLPWTERLRWMAAASVPGILARLSAPAQEQARLIERTRLRVAREFDDHGARRGHTKASQKPDQRAAVANAAPLYWLSRWRAIRDSPAWERIARFHKWCEARDVRLVATFPPTISFPEYFGKRGGRTANMIVKRYQALGIEVAGTPADFLLDREFFYDTIYHLTEEGMRAHTARLIEKLGPIVTVTR